MFSLAGYAAPFLRGIFFSPTVKSLAKVIVITEVNPPFFAWAQNFKKTFEAAGADMVKIENGVSIPIVANRLKMAATMAGPRGILILSVGHGAIIGKQGEPGFQDTEGFFNLGPGGSFQVGGSSALLVGDPPPKKPPFHFLHTSAFYDLRMPHPGLKGGFGDSRKDEDEKSQSHSAKIRLDNFRHYEDISNTFKKIGLSAVIFLTCRVGAATGFVKRVREQWGTPIIGYPRRVKGDPQANGRTRVYLEGDAPGSGTNIPFGEFLFPLSKDMVVIP
jgi:hypothetical protein